jgi:hypothetical protein
VNDQEIEREIRAKGLTAPRVTPERIAQVIKSEHYFTALQGARMSGLDAATEGDAQTLNAVAPHVLELGLLTFCVLVLENGFTVSGESACASPENFDAELGRKIARQKAVEKIWPLEGYALRERLAKAPTAG